MLWHPSGLMIRTWALCLLILLVMPIHLISREQSVFGYVMISLFIMAFYVGGYLRSRKIPDSVFTTKRPLDFKVTDGILILAAIAAIIVYGLEVASSGAGDLSTAWEIRSERTSLLLEGLDSGSSIWFQLGFLLYPVGYVYIAREIVFKQKINLFRLGAFGFGPLIACAIAIGGRGPILFALVVLGLSILARRQHFRTTENKGVEIATQPKRKRAAYAILIVAVTLVAMNYFIRVFVVRAESGGGLDAIFQNVATAWGVDFSGMGSDFIRTFLGEGNAYLLFAFSWYLVQGPVLANEIFTQFNGDPGYGVYGVELATSLMRRFNSGFVADRLFELDRINVFGFVYSAFGTLFIDFWYFGLIVSMIWGYLAAAVYSRVRLDEDGRWLLFGPFMTMGVLFSLINTPIGLSNGLVTYAWVFVAFFTMRRRSVVAPVLARFIPTRR
jgi:hypothetical protein